MTDPSVISTEPALGAFNTPYQFILKPEENAKILADFGAFRAIKRVEISVDNVKSVKVTVKDRKGGVVFFGESEPLDKGVRHNLILSYFEHLSFCYFQPIIYVINTGKLSPK